MKVASLPKDLVSSSLEGSAGIHLPPAPALIQPAQESLDPNLRNLAVRHEDSSFNWVLDRRIGIGNVFAAKDIVLIKEEGIRSIFGLTEELLSVRPAQLGVEKIVVRPMLDGHGNQASAFCHMIDDLVRLEREHGPVMVHCHAGRSRSVILVAGYLRRTQGYFPEVALRLVQKHRHSQIQPGLKPLLNTVQPRGGPA